MHRTSRRKKQPNEPRTPRCGLHDVIECLNISSRQLVGFHEDGTTQPTDRVQAERHWTERTKREHPTFLANYDIPVTQFCPVTPRPRPPISAPSYSNGPQDARSRQPSASRIAQTPPPPVPSGAHGATSPGASSTAGSFFSTVLSPSVSSDEMDVDSPPDMQRSTGDKQTRLLSRSSPSPGPKSRVKKSDRSG